MYYSSEFQSRLVDFGAYQHKVCLEFSRPRKPTNSAHIESFNGRLRDECLDAHRFDDLTQVRAMIDAWRTHYNESGPHKALKQLTLQEYPEQLMQQDQNLQADWIEGRGTVNGFNFSHQFRTEFGVKFVPGFRLA